MERADRYKRDIEEYYNKIKELNEMLMRMRSLVVLRFGTGFLDQIASIHGTKCTG